MSKILIGLFCILSVMNLQGQDPLSIQNWEYVAGKSDETLNTYTIPDFVNAEKVILPHRLIRPNSAFWYRSQLDVSGDVYLTLGADDGAQLWVNGKRIFANDEDLYIFGYFQGQMTIVVRVLNNAVAGGLNRATLLYGTPKEMEKMSSGRDRNLSSDSFCFSFWGDSQGGWETFSGFVDKIKLFNDPLTIGLGDLTANGKDLTQWEDYKKCIFPLFGTTDIRTIPGNHDYDGYYDDLDPILYKKNTGTKCGEKTYGFFTAGKNAFLSLDINKNFPLGIDEMQQTYIDSIVQTDEWRKAEWRFVLVHQPPYGQGWKSYAGEDSVREWVEKSAEKYQIDFVLSGHIHDYERLTKNFGSQKTTFIVSGGAGGSLEPSESNPIPMMDKVIKKHHICRLCLQKKEARLTVYSLDSEILDHHTIIKQ